MIERFEALAEEFLELAEARSGYSLTDRAQFVRAAAVAQQTVDIYLARATTIDFTPVHTGPPVFSEPEATDGTQT